MNRRELPKLGVENEATTNIKLRAMSRGDEAFMEDWNLHSEILMVASLK